MASTAAALKNAALVIIAVCAVLLHSSMGQQQQQPAPAPASKLDCSNCSRICTMRCQAMADAQGRYCSTMIRGTTGGVYDSCFQAITAHTCNGNSYVARGTCTIGWCTAKLCGSPCVRGACESCTAAARDAYTCCMAYQGTIMQSCMPDCTNNCESYGYCVSV